MKHKSLFLLLSFLISCFIGAFASIRDGDGILGADSYGEAWAAAKEKREEEERARKEQEERERKEKEEQEKNKS